MIKLTVYITVAYTSTGYISNIKDILTSIYKRFIEHIYVEYSHDSYCSINGVMISVTLLRSNRAAI